MKGYSPPRSVQPVVFVCQAPDPTLDTSAHPGLISALTKATSKLTLSLSLSLLSSAQPGNYVLIVAVGMKRTQSLFLSPGL